MRKISAAVEIRGGNMNKSATTGRRMFCLAGMAKEQKTREKLCGKVRIIYPNDPG